ncbi:MAG: hypothetical protein GYA62_16030 [Bacteroidales bacterium]|jgi:hypothetical protein|nr:hypothetical protein [Bacteroidales bacterium]
MRLVFITILTFVLFYACKEKENVVPEPIDKSYYPMNVNDETIYFVEYINIDNPISLYDTQRYYLKERIESTYNDETGNPIYRIERYKRSDTLSNWDLIDVWLSQYYENQAHKVEENIRYVKLVFPVAKGLKWNGNAMNTLDAQTYEIDTLDKSWKNFDSTLVVVQQNKQTLIDKYLDYERFAKHKGLVEKIFVHISQAYVIQNVPIENRIVRGEIYKQTVVE